MVWVSLGKGRGRSRDPNTHLPPSLSPAPTTLPAMGVLSYTSYAGISTATVITLYLVLSGTSAHRWLEREGRTTEVDEADESSSLSSPQPVIASPQASHYALRHVSEVAKRLLSMRAARQPRPRPSHGQSARAVELELASTSPVPPLSRSSTDAHTLACLCRSSIHRSRRRSVHY